MKKMISVLAAWLMVFGCIFSGCSNKDELNPKKPVTVTLWHSYPGEMEAALGELAEEFNATVGLERGVIVALPDGLSSAEQEGRLGRIATGEADPGEMPDMTTADWRTALLLREMGLLAPLDGLFSEDQMAGIVPDLLEEGRLGEGQLYLFPVARSSQVLFVNRSLFNRFGAAVGVPFESLSTFEGIAGAAVKYYQWSDAQTPDVPGDGKTFFTAGSWADMAKTGAAQLGNKVETLKELRGDSETFQRIWEVSVVPALAGGYAITDTPAIGLLQTGEILCAIGSSAEILGLGDTVTDAEGNRQRVTYSVLPYPTFEGGAKAVLQEGAGVCIARTTPKKELACAAFLEWLTRPEQNLRLVVPGGTMPAARAAYGPSAAEYLEGMSPGNGSRLFQTLTRMSGEYEFLTSPRYEGYEAEKEAYESALKAAMAKGRTSLSAGIPLSGEEAGEKLQAISVSLLEDFWRRAG